MKLVDFCADHKSLYRTKTQFAAIYAETIHYVSMLGQLIFAVIADTPMRLIHINVLDNCFEVGNINIRQRMTENVYI